MITFFLTWKATKAPSFMQQEFCLMEGTLLVFPLDIFLRFCYSWYVKLSIAQFPYAECDFMGSFILNFKGLEYVVTWEKITKAFLGSDIGEFVVTIFFTARYFKVCTSSEQLRC